MTDGTTAIPVSPVSEEDMSKARQIFEQALNSLVSLSQLSKDVEALRAQVGDLTNQLNRYRSQIDTLDDALYRTRQERDAATTRANQAEQDKAEAESKERSIYTNYQMALADLAIAKDTIVRLQRESDDHLTKALEWEDKYNVVNRKLEEVREKFKSLFPEVTPSPTPVAVVVDENVHNLPPPEPTPEPTPQPVTDDRPWWVKDQEERAASQS